MRRRRAVVGAAVALAIVAAAVLYLFVVSPAGAGSAQEAVTKRIGDRADRNSTRVLVKRDWGDGQLVLAGFSRRAERRLALAFAIERGRGWHVVAYTERTAMVSDVVVGSLLVASSSGGSGQPAWSAAVGELNDPRVKTVEVSWMSDGTSSAERTNDSYLVVHRGRVSPRAARYLDGERTEIASVPIDTS
jgi:hypothetical protein